MQNKDITNWSVGSDNDDILGFLSAERMGRLEIKLAQISVPVVNWNNVPHLFSTSKK